MKKKTMLIFMLMLCICLTFAACGGNDAQGSGSAGEGGETTAQEGDSTLKTVNPGVLTVATSPDFAPYEFYAIGEDGTPKLAGFDIDFAQYIADYAGLELEIIPMDFDGVLMELQTKAVDLGVAGLQPKPERLSAMDYSDPYYQTSQSLITIESKADLFKSFEDVNKPEISVGAQLASLQVDFANQYTPDADIVTLPKVTDLISELVTGKIDGVYVETSVALSYKKNYPEIVVALDVPFDSQGATIGVSKGNAELLALVNEAIAKATSDGTMDDFVAKANELASGEKYEGLLDAEGNVQQK